MLNKRSGYHFRIKPIRTFTSIIPIFTARVVTFLVGLFFIVWSFAAFSNEFFLLSSFTGIRNFMCEKQTFDSRINVLHIDTDSYLLMSEKYRDKTDLEYRLLAESIGVLGDLAKNNRQEPLIVGIDEALLKGSGESEKLAATLAAIPENMFIVFGGVLGSDWLSGYYYFRSDITYNLVQNALEKFQNKNPSSEEQDQFLKRFFIGNLHFAMGTTRSGFNNETMKTVIGYVPYFEASPSGGLSKLNFSLPYLMFILGEAGNNQAGKLAQCDLLQGSWTPPGDLLDLKPSFLYYNFYDSRDISQLEDQYYKLFDYSPEIAGIRDEPASVLTGTGKRYFLITTGANPDYMDIGGKDKIITPVSKKSEFTGTIESLTGVMAHLTALDNLLHKTYIQKSPCWLHLIVILLFLGVLVFVFWNYDLLSSIIALSLSLVFIVTLSFSLFIFNRVLFLFQSEAIMIFALFSIVTFIRIKATEKMNKCFDGATAGVIPENNLEKYDIKEISDLQRTVKNGLVMIIVPKGLGENEKCYHKVFEYYVTSVFRIIEVYEGNHLLCNNSIVGFWFDSGQAAELGGRVVQGAFNCLQVVDDLWSYRDACYPEEKESAPVTFDIVIYYGTYQLGCVQYRDSGIINIGGGQFNLLLATSLMETADNRNTVLISDEVKQQLKDHRQYNIVKTEKSITYQDKEVRLYQVTRK
jgi:hypothetical protein